MPGAKLAIASVRRDSAWLEELVIEDDPGLHPPNGFDA
jgi:hypothetical protein